MNAIVRAKHSIHVYYASRSVMLERPFTARSTYLVTHSEGSPPLEHDCDLLFFRKTRFHALVPVNFLDF